MDALDPEVFKSEMVALHEYFGKALTPERANIAYDYLNHRISADGLKKACLLSKQEDSFLPAPKQLLEKVGGSTEQKAISEWEKILAGFNDYAPGSLLPKLPDGLSVAGVNSLRLMGGMNGLSHANPDEYPALLRQFLQLYKSLVAANKRALEPYVPPTPSLPPIAPYEFKESTTEAPVYLDREETRAMFLSVGKQREATMIEKQQQRLSQSFDDDDQWIRRMLNGTPAMHKEAIKELEANADRLEPIRESGKIVDFRTRNQ